jgi:PmbA protein
MDYQLLITKAEEKGFSDIEVYVSSSRDLSISLFKGKVDKNEFSNTSTISIRAIYDNKMAYLSLENINEDIDYILDNLKNNARSLTTEEEFEIYPGDESYPEVPELNHDFNKYSNLDKINLLKKIESSIYDADKRITFVSHCNYIEDEAAVQIINSKKLDVKQENAFCYIAVQAVASENDDNQSGFELSVKHRIDEFNAEEICKEVVEKTVSMLNAKSVKSGVYPVIVENKAMASLFATFTSIFSGEAAIKKITPLLDKLGTQFLSEKITITDDPLNSEAIFKHPFDDEGVACYKKNVVENGIFKTFLHNLKTAKYFKTKSTGNGFKMGNNIGVSGTNLIIQPGVSTIDQLIKNTEKGLLLTSFDGLHSGVNSISGDFSLKTAGYLIENGVKVRPVTLIVVASNFFKMMKNVEDIANDIKLGYNGIGSPSIKFNGLAISGE